MKILHFIYDHVNNPWVGGGGAIRTYEIYRRLSEKGHEITIVSGKYPGAADYSKERIKYVFLGSDGNYLIGSVHLLVSTYTAPHKPETLLQESVSGYSEPSMYGRGK